MAEAIVFNLLAKLTPLLQTEMTLLSGLKEEIRAMGDEFEYMSAFLRVADAMEESDPDLEVWVKQVRQAAFDTEDVLDTFMLRFVYCQGSDLFGKVWNFTKALPARHQIASKVQKIKSRVIEISERHKRYLSRYADLELASVSNMAENDWDSRRGDALLLEETEIVGTGKPKSELIRWLMLEDPELKVFSVVGMGGAGKTTLIKRVYDDVAVKNHFHNHAWITVSEFFKIEELLKRMIRVLFDQVKQSAPRGMNTMDSCSLKEIIKTFLYQKRFVVVLDDVWTIQAWEALRYIFPDSKCRSRVLLTTRNVEVAHLSRNQYNGKVYNQLPLSLEETWTLFCRTVFQKKSCPPHLEGISRSILKRCEGLPLAIVAIGGLLSITDPNEWQRINRSFGEELQGDKLLSMKKVMSLSYIGLPWYLKICFLYLSIFPEDCFIDHWRLIRLWVAEGFVQVRNAMEAEEVAEGYLKELLSRNLIQIAKTSVDGRVKAYRIHDLWREMIVSRSREQNLVTVVNEENTLWPEKVRRFSIQKHSELIKQKKCFSRLRSLFVFDSSVSANVVLASLNDDIKLVRVIDFKGVLMQKLPDAFAHLFHLKYLSLRWTNVTALPGWIGELQNLETLDLKHTYITELPVEILKLHRLCHLLLYRHKEASAYHSFHNESGFKPPLGIGSLSSLQKLCSIEACNGNVLAELRNLCRLRRLRILKMRHEDGRKLCSSLDKLTNLQSLHVNAAGENEVIDLDSLASPPPFLRHLWLEGRLERVPHWIPRLRNLVNLSLRWSKLRDDEIYPLQLIQGLPNLVCLGLREAYEGEMICFSAGGFRRLKKMWITGLKQLRWVTIEAGSAPHLEALYITKCTSLEEMPSGIENLTELKYLELNHLSNELMLKLNEDDQSEEKLKVAHVQHVRIGGHIDGQRGFWFLRRDRQLSPG